MRLSFLPGLLLFTLAGCGGPKQPEPRPASPDPASEVSSPDTSDRLELRQFFVGRSVAPDSLQTVDSTCIIAISPSLEEARMAQEEGTGEDFETAADDYAYYFSDVIERAEKANVPIVEAVKRYLRFRISGNSFVVVDTRAAGPGSWNPILFRTGSDPVLYRLVGNPDTAAISTFFGRK
jgi:hypothetical protein